MLKNKYKHIKNYLRSKCVPTYLHSDPNFIIIGGMKCGTTSLWNYIMRHSQSEWPERKEIHFFDLNFEKGKKWYKKKFPIRPKMRMNGKKVTGEASPGYLYNPLVPKRIYNMFPDVNIIALLRNPAARAISNYWHEYNAGREEITMEEAFNREKNILEGNSLTARERYRKIKPLHSYLDKGKYTDLLHRYENLFGEKMLILKSERFFEKTQDVFDEVTNFVGIEKEELIKKDKINEGKYREETKKSVKKMLVDYYEKECEKIEKEFGICFDLERVKNF